PQHDHPGPGEEPQQSPQAAGDPAGDRAPDQQRDRRRPLREQLPAVGHLPGQLALPCQGGGRMLSMTKLRRSTLLAGIALLAVVGLSGCSMIPGSWKAAFGQAIEVTAYFDNV